MWEPWVRTISKANFKDEAIKLSEQHDLCVNTLVIEIDTETTTSDEHRWEQSTRMSVSRSWDCG